MSVTTNTKSVVPECFGCKSAITDASYLSVSPGTHWHDDCLRCRLCKIKLDERTTCFMDRFGFPYCKKDYPRRFFHQCSACQKNLHQNDLVQRAKSNMYHADCFRCEACQKCLQAGDEFLLSSDNRILCRNDFDSIFNGNHNTFDKLKTLDCQKLLNSTNIIGKHEFSSSDLNKTNSNENTTRSTLSQRKKAAKANSSSKLNSSIEDLDSNDERHKSTDDSSSLSPNGSASQQMTSNSAERRPRRDKQQRVRTVLTEKQLHLLKSCYAYNARPDALLKEQLAEMTELSPRVIRVWFQNKRCKDKKKTAAQQARFPTDPKMSPFQRHRLDMPPMAPIVSNGESYLLGHPMSVLSPCNSQAGGPPGVNGNQAMYEGGPLTSLQSVAPVNTSGPYLNTRDGMIYSLTTSPPSNSDDSYVMGHHGPMPGMSCSNEWMDHPHPGPNDYQTNMPMYHPVHMNDEELEDHDMLMPVEDDSLDQTNSDYSDG